MIAIAVAVAVAMGIAIAHRSYIRVALNHASGVAVASYHRADNIATLATLNTKILTRFMNGFM